MSMDQSGTGVRRSPHISRPHLGLSEGRFQFSLRTVSLQLSCLSQLSCDTRAVTLEPPALGRLIELHHSCVVSRLSGLHGIVPPPTLHLKLGTPVGIELATVTFVDTTV